MKESSSRTIIDSFKSFLIYYSNFSLLLCKKHKLAFFRKSLKAHIKKHLNDLSISSFFYKEIIDFFDFYHIFTPEDIYKRFQSIKKIKSFFELDITSNAFFYINCKSIFLSKKKSQIHYKKAYSFNFTSLIKENIQFQRLLSSLTSISCDTLIGYQSIYQNGWAYFHGWYSNLARNWYPDRNPIKSIRINLKFFLLIERKILYLTIKKFQKSLKV